MSMGGMGGMGGGVPWGKIGQSLGAHLNFGIANYANNEAANTLTDAEHQWFDFLKPIYEGVHTDQLARMSPYYKQGTAAWGKLGDLYGLNGKPADYSGFYESPDYKGALEQGTAAVDRSAAAKGGFFSGGHSKDLVRFGQGLATQYLGNYTNQLAGMSNVGMNAGVQMNNIDNQYVTNMETLGQGYLRQGDIRAAEYLGFAGAWNAMHQDLMSIWGGGSGGSNPSGGGQNYFGMATNGMAGGMSQGMGEAMGGAMGDAMGGGYNWSDRRLKSDIRRVGTLDSGLPVYVYRIHGRTEMGVMADEAQQLYPHAVISVNGRQMVDYAQIGR